MKLFTALFNQRRSTPDSLRKPNPVVRYAECHCLDAQYKKCKWTELIFHDDVQDTNCDSWRSLEQYITDVASRGGEEFNPLDAIGPENWEKIVTLPPSIGNLKSVIFVTLYGSHLVRIPPEIGEMSSLEEFDAYTSYRLHWLPYEITRCRKLTTSRISTRALYGNYKYHAAFPRLPVRWPELIPATCSVCSGLFSERGPHQLWISLRVGTDVLPLLVNACSSDCINALPSPADGYLPRPHRGGLGNKQTPTP